MVLQILHLSLDFDWLPLLLFDVDLAIGLDLETPLFSSTSSPTKDSLYFVRAILWCLNLHLEHLNLEQEIKMKVPYIKQILMCSDFTAM